MAQYKPAPLTEMKYDPNTKQWYNTGRATQTVKDDIATQTDFVKENEKQAFLSDVKPYKYENLTPGQQKQLLDYGIVSQESFDEYNKYLGELEKQQRAGLAGSTKSQVPSRGVAFSASGVKNVNRQPTGTPEVNQATILANLKAKGVDTSQITPETMSQLVSDFQKNALVNRANMGAATGYRTEPEKPAYISDEVWNKIRGAATSETTAPTGAQEEMGAATGEAPQAGATQAGTAKTEGLISGGGLTDVILSSDESLSKKVYENEKDIIEKTAEINKLNIDRQLADAKNQLIYKDGKPYSLNLATEEEIARPFSLETEMAEAQRANEIAIKKAELARYNSDADMAISKMQNELIEQDLALRSQAAMHGWNYNSAISLKMAKELSGTKNLINAAYLDKANKAGLIDQQIGAIETKWNAEIYDIAERREEEKTKRYNELIKTINGIFDDETLDELEKEKKLLKAEQDYVENYSKEQELHYKSIKEASDNAKNDVNWFTNHDPNPIFSDAKGNPTNSRINSDGTVTMAWTDKKTGLPVITKSQDLGLDQSIISAVTGTTETIEPSIITENQYTEGQKLLLSSIDFEKGITAAQKEALSEVGLTVQDAADFQSSTGKTLSPDKKQDIENIISSIDNLLNMEGMSAAVGTGLQKILTPWKGEEEFIPGTAAQDYAREFVSFRDRLVLPNLDKMKGAMSDNDIRFIRNSATSLSLSQSEKTFKKRLEELKQTYEKILNESGSIQSEQDQYNDFINNLDAYFPDADTTTLQNLSEEQKQQLYQQTFLVPAPSAGGEVQPQSAKVSLVGNKIITNLSSGQTLGGSSQGNSGQCGYTFNQLSKKLGLKQSVGDTVKSKIALIKKESPNIPEVGGAAISATNQYGHVMMVTQKSFTGQPKEGDTIQVIDSNRISPYKINTRTLVYKNGSWISKEFGDEKIDGFGAGKMYSNIS